jgi:hypothetical protein
MLFANAEYCYRLQGEQSLTAFSISHADCWALLAVARRGIQLRDHLKIGAWYENFQGVT